MSQNDIVNSNLATFNNPGINNLIAASKKNKLTLDNFSNYYILENQIKLGFPLLKKYDNILKSSLSTITIEKDLYYRPEYVSYKLYGTTDLWYLIMYLNNVYKVEDFVGPTIQVPAYDPLTVLNKIINDEADNKHTVDNPEPLKKSYLKHPSLASDIITKTRSDKTIPWVRGSKILSNPNFPWSSLFYKTEFYLKSGTVKDENGNSVKAITLDKSGTTSIPSVYFQNGYEKTLKGRVYLEENMHYSLFKNMNGSATFQVTKDKKEIAYEKFNHNFGEATLIADSRSANIESTTGLTSIYNSVVDFDTVKGVYKFNSLVNNPKEDLLRDGVYLAKTTFIPQTNNERLDVKRLNGSSSIGANIIYSFNKGNADYLNILEHQIVITYSDSTTKISPVSTPRLDVVDTQGHKSVLKVVCENSPSKQISKIEVKTLIKFKKIPTGSFNLSYNLYGVHLFRLMDSDSMSVPFKAPSTGWYDFSLHYTYKISDDNGYDLFPDDYYHGIYFNPKIVEVTSEGTINHGKELKINDAGNMVDPNMFELTGPTTEVTSPKSTRDCRLYTGSLSFPKEFMLTLKLEHLSLSTGGGVGFVFNYDKQKEQGYMLWISSTGTNPDLPEFSQDAGQNILRTGFYELDSEEGTPHQIFRGDSSTTISVSNYRPLEINGRWLKIIRHLNRIRIFSTDSNGNLTSDSRPLLDLQDISNFHLNGGWMLMGLYAGARLTVGNYETWQNLALVEKGSDW